MKKKQLMYVSLAATALASCMTSCIENEEGEGLKALREGQADYWKAKGEAEKISANAQLVAAQGLADLQAAQAKVQEAEAKAKEAQIALTEATAKQMQIANDYAEKKNALDLELQKALDELEVAKAKAEKDLAVAQSENAIELAKAENAVAIAKAEKKVADTKNAIELAAEQHKIDMDALEATRLENEKNLYTAKAALVAEKETYEAAIIQAETDLATAKKDHEVSMAAIEDELAKLEETKAQYLVELEQLKKENATTNATKDEELRQAAIAQEITVISNNLQNYNDIVAKIKTAYDAFVTAQKDEIDANATYAQAIDTYTKALADATNGDIDAVTTKAKEVLAKNNDIKDAEYALLTAERSLVSSERAVTRAKEALAKFNETDKASAEKILEAMTAENDNIKELKDVKAAMQLEIDKATIAKTEADAALTAAKDKLQEVLDEEIKKVQEAVWALNDGETVNGDNADGDQYYSVAEKLAAELQAASDANDEAKAANQEAYDKEIAALDKQIAAINEANDLLDEEIDELDNEMVKIYDELQEKFVGLSDKLVELNDEKMQWYDQKVKDFKLTVGETIEDDFATWVKETALDVNGIQYFDIKDGKIVLADAYAEWLTNVALTCGSYQFEYNYQIDGKYDAVNLFAQAYIAKRGQKSGLGGYWYYEDYYYQNNQWVTKSIFKNNPVYILDQKLSDLVTYHDGAYKSAYSSMLSAAYNINNAANGLNSAIEIDVVNFAKETIDTKKLKTSQDEVNKYLTQIKTDNPDTWNDETTTEGGIYKSYNDLLSEYTKYYSSYNTNLSKHAEYSQADTELQKYMEDANDALKAIMDKISAADTEMGIAFKNIVDEHATAIAALNEQINKKSEEKAANDKEIARIESEDKAAAAKVKADADKAAQKVYDDAAEVNADKVAENDKAIKELKKQIAEAELEYAKSLAALEEYAAVEAAQKVVDELTAEKTDIETDITNAESLVSALDALYTYILTADTHETTNESLEDVIADKELSLSQAIEDAEIALEKANRDVESAELDVQVAKDELQKYENLDFEKEYDAVAEAEDDLAEAKLDLEAAEKAFEIAKKEYEDAVAAWNKYLGEE